ncbi:hypothetical protein F5B22DRAFT_233200 [Xylaria bambusicola]|uniref:uncharacterized protein n=1 Tax=Xylaria bambusicola TaxID=326684 RepID=UPI002007FC05|nr:uncharacterized protein F5B22DRAFT_233200 [Xylaria bambusicola]KAI0514573.1 hypothetical protein F5B22DRAFT_233200 [Xylaria bambusicola]
MAAPEDPRTKFGLTCPVDGKFHICQKSSTKFIGCCKVDPCTSELDGVCPDSELFVASYSAASGVMFLKQDCADPLNGSWYTCDNARPPFLGCCKNNPCNNGCLDGNLVAAALSNDPRNASQLMLPDTTTTTTTGTISSSSSSSTTGTAVLPKGTESSSSSDGARAGMIAGISVAGVVILLLVIAAYLWVKRRERARQESEYEPGLANGTSENVIPSHGFFQGKYS